MQTARLGQRDRKAPLDKLTGLSNGTSSRPCRDDPRILRRLTDLSGETNQVAQEVDRRVKSMSDASAHPRILVLLGGGGHTTEMLRLLDLLGSAYEYHYLVTSEDARSEGKIRCPGAVYRVPRPRYNIGRRHKPVRDSWLSMVCFFGVLPLMRLIRPSAMLTNGGWIGAIAAAAARLYGVRVIFVETGARVTRLSRTGTVMRFLADDFFVQWESLSSLVPKARYAGRLW
jgi:hypothetical protein